MKIGSLIHTMDGICCPIICWKAFQKKVEVGKIILRSTDNVDTYRIESIDIETSEGPYKVIKPEYKQSSYHVKIDMFGLVHIF